MSVLAAKPPCTIDGCDRETLVKNLCSAHYQRAWAYGDPATGGPLKPRRNVDTQSKCSVPECDRAARNRGLCGNHYAQARHHGLVNQHQKQRQLSADCSVPECHGERYGHGLCNKHYMRAKRGGILGQYSRADQTSVEPPVRTRRNPVCSEPACNGARHALGLCSQHYYRQLRSASPHPPKPPEPPKQNRSPRLCSVAGCGLRHSSRGLCKNHYAQAERRSEPRCVAPGCEYAQRFYGLCKRHFNRAVHNDALDLFEPADKTAAATPRRKLTPDQVRKIDAALRKARQDFMSGAISRQQLDARIAACQAQIRAYAS